MTTSTTVFHKQYRLFVYIPVISSHFPPFKIAKRAHSLSPYFLCNIFCVSFEFHYILMFWILVFDFSYYSLCIGLECNAIDTNHTNLSIYFFLFHISSILFESKHTQQSTNWTTSQVVAINGIHDKCFVAFLPEFIVDYSTTQRSTVIGTYVFIIKYIG